MHVTRYTKKKKIIGWYLNDLLEIEDKLRTRKTRFFFTSFITRGFQSVITQQTSSLHIAVDIYPLVAQWIDDLLGNSNCVFFFCL